MKKRRVNKKNIFILAVFVAVFVTGFFLLPKGLKTGKTESSSSKAAVMTGNGINGEGNDVKSSAFGAGNGVKSGTAGELESGTAERSGDIRSLTFRAVGDNLIHKTIYRQASDRANGGKRYDFEYAYKNIESFVAEADLAFINQETIVTDDAFEPSTYPQFNSPPELGDHMINIGFDLFGLANNHSYDKHEKGVLESIKFWEKRKAVTAVGMYAEDSKKDIIPMIEKNGIKIAFLAFAENTNGISLPSSANASVIYISETERVKKCLALAEEKADMTIVSVHFGTEDSTQVNNTQINFAEFITENGADLIIGTHPHVLQKIDRIKTESNESLVIYSLGNFISAQDTALNLLGGMLDLKINVNTKTKEIEFERVKLIPIVTHYNSGYANLRIIKVKDYTDELASAHGVKNFGQEMSVSFLNRRAKEIIGEEFLDLVS